MVHPSSRFYRCLCRVIIASMLFQTGCYSGHKTYTHLPTEPPSTIRPLLESGKWTLEVELRDGSRIKVTPLNSEFGEALYVETQQVRGELVSWDEETIRLKRVWEFFWAAKKADVFYDIPVAEARQISFNKAAKEFDPEKTVGAVAAVGALLTISFLSKVSFFLLTSLSEKSKGKKIILYLPTYRNEEKAQKELESNLTKLADLFKADEQFIFVYKTHFVLKDNSKNNIKLAHRGISREIFEFSSTSGLNRMSTLFSPSFSGD